MTNETSASSNSTSCSRWHDLSNHVLNGRSINHNQAVQVLEAPDLELLDLLAATYRIRHRYFGNTVQLYFLMNAKSGLCPEDCSYCSQSKIASSNIPRYNLLQPTKLLDGARVAAERCAKTYCIVISARSPSEHEINTVEQIVPQIKEKYNLKICACLGLLTPEHAKRLQACGVDRVNHNLNTSDNFYGQICTTHSYQDRVDTLRAVRQAGMELCSGGIIGMGEQKMDVVDMAFKLRELEVESIPVNFLNSIEGTPLENMNHLNPRYCLKTLAMFRMVNPDREIRIAGGRELHLSSMQCLGLYAANSLFVGDYLTTQGQLPEADYRMVKEMGFEVIEPSASRE